MRPLMLCVFLCVQLPDVNRLDPFDQLPRHDGHLLDDLWLPLGLSCVLPSELAAASAIARIA